MGVAMVVFIAVAVCAVAVAGACVVAGCYSLAGELCRSAICGSDVV